MEVSAKEWSERRMQAQVDEAADREVARAREFDSIGLRADRQHIHESLKKQHWHRTVRVGETKT